MKNKLLPCLLLSLLSCNTVYADDNSENLPWLTGPLLAPPSLTMPAGKTNIEPFLFITNTFGKYNNHWSATNVADKITTSPVLFIVQGLSKHFDIQASIPYIMNASQQQFASGIGDVGAGLGFQALNQKTGSWRPDLRLVLQETFPSGRYENLNPNKKGTDAIGAGSYQTAIQANFGKLVKFKGEHYLNTTLSFSYIIPSAVKIRGFNTYGGGFNTNGTLMYGNVFITDLAFEYTLTEHWVPAVDMVYSVSSNTNKFSGTAGTTASGGSIAATTSQPGFQQISLAPAIEYNFSSHLGLIVGSWFTIAGKNSGQFASAVAALNYVS